MASVLFTRWFQSQVFTPGFRLPAQVSTPTPWAAPAPTQRVLVDFIDLRRRLSQYVSSTSATQITAGEDEAVWLSSASPKDYTRAAGRLRGFAFGPNLWIKPLPASEDTPAPLALPPDSHWIDFWTGVAYAGGKTLRLSTPLDRLPLFVRAGAILPIDNHSTAPSAQDNSLELRVYPGADGEFTLRRASDEMITMTWDDQTRTLKIGTCQRILEQSSAKCCLKVVLVRPGHGVGHRSHARPDQEILYDGKEMSVQLPSAAARPRAPVGLHAHLRAERIIFTWQHSIDGVVYRLKRSSNAHGPLEDVASSLVNPEFSIPLSDSKAGDYYVVTAMNDGGESLASAPVQTPVSQPRTATIKPETSFLRVPDSRVAFNALGATRSLPTIVASSNSRTRTPEAAKS